LASINTAMPRISRHRDKCRTGHSCDTTAPVLCSQFTVFANGKPILHKANLTGSSRTVFVKGIGVGRKGDRADRGAMTGASFDVFAG